MIFSERIRYPFELNELSKLIEVKDKNNLINLAESNPTKAGIIYEHKILNYFFKNDNLKYYPDPKGIKEAREAVLDYYKLKGVFISLEDIFLTSGTSEAYSFIFKILCDPLDNILIPFPGYPLFDYLSSLELVKTKHYRLEYFHNSGWKIDFDSIVQSIDKKTKAIVLINPNNPTGSYVSDEDKRKIIDIAKKNDIAIIADEVFFDYNIDDKVYHSFAGNKDCLTFVLSGISKILALPQMKLSWIVVSGEEKIKREAIDRLELVSDTFLSVSIPIQNALKDFFLAGEIIKKNIIERIKENYLYIKECVKDSPIRLLDTSGGWSTVIELPRILSEEEWVKKLLMEENCLVYPGYFFDFEREAFCSISLIVEKDILIRGIKSIENILQKYQI
ncbi:MAG: pyridoxal phosphate-dependent aminotransferase [Brevinematales bacterium]|nr:pyridoxal phosphate-dependent aminotransferase [Brevinematales bacterium]